MSDVITYVDIKENTYWPTVTENGVYTVVIPNFEHIPGAVVKIKPDTSNVGFINVNGVADLPITSEFPLTAGAYYDLIFDAVNVCFVVNKTVLLNVINSPNGLIVKATTTYKERFVAVGYGTNSIAYSANGIDWTGLGTGIFSAGGRGVCWNGSKFVAVGEGTNSIAYSANGIDWTGLGTGILSICSGVCWNGSMFVAVGNGGIAYSSDGENWTKVVIPSQLHSVCWNGSIFVASAIITNSIYYSFNGIDWTGTGNSVITNGFGVCWNGSIFVLVGNGINEIVYSSNGTDWIGTNTTVFNASCDGVCWNGSIFVSFGQTINSIAYSLNGINWTGLGAGIFSYGFGACWNGSKFIAVGEGTNSIAYSPNGIDWTGLGAGIFSVRGRGVCSTSSPQLVPIPSPNIAPYTQTANLQEWQDSEGITKASVSPDGDISGRDLKFTRDLYYGTTKILPKVGNDAIIVNDVIYGKMALNKGVYTGNATARPISTVFHPHFGCCKSATAVYGALWTVLGGSKGYAVANSVGNFMGVSADGAGFDLGTGAFCNTNLAAYKYFALAAHGGALTGVKAKLITWTGNNTDNRNLDIGLDPDVFIVKAANANYALFKTTDHTGEACSYFLYGAADLATNGIQAMGDLGGGVHGVQLGTNAAVNSAGIVYNGLALKSDAAGTAEIAITKFNGMAGDGCKVWLPFQANAIFAIPAGALACLFWTSAMTAGETGIISAASANITDGIRRADADGVIIGSGTEINTVNNTVNLVAIKCDL